ncbi:hypothetical protein ACN1NW_000377 [Acinetobacter baumannii]|nr:hypothetical protein [Acinetobacter baumannii]ELA7030967.1 hypothetical protein [Acinetobacter baumannii]ELA7118730.1 hypothetical protein [Acinetobacter baumannii]ELB0919679.1 hypothetical protein [Acinetobacter baumannii]ELB0965855.1 hypothetical protein [Acinetobacter baumannii]
MHLLQGTKPLKVFLVVALLVIVSAWSYLLGSNNAANKAKQQAETVIHSQKIK